MPGTAASTETGIQTPKLRKRLRISRLAFAVVLVIAAIIGLGAIGVIVSALVSMPDWNPAMIAGAMTTTVYDRDNQPVASLHGTENRYPVSLNEIPTHLQEALVATEDTRFYQHHGFDPRGIARAAVVNITKGRIEQGGSTITQQLAENAFFDRQERSFKRKVQEVIMAVQLERMYSKEELLEFYFNEIYLGYGAYGVQAASHLYFDKDVKDLNLAESAMLVGLIKSPGTYSPLKDGNMPRAKERQSQILENMVRYGYIDSEEAEAARQTELNIKGYTPETAYRYPFYIDYVVETAEALLAANNLDEKLVFTGGLKIYTALDTKTQQKMEAIYADAENFPKSPDDRPVQSAMVIIDPSNGGVVSMVGGRNSQAMRGWNRATQARRQPGSSIKPVAVYAPAIEQAGYSPSTVVNDAPVSFGGYSPKNYDGSYRGPITLREATRWSVNIVAVKVLNSIGVERGYEFARNMGIPVNESSKNLALALGATEASPLEMAAAYATFASGGIYTEPHAILRITDRFDRVLIDVKPVRRVVMSEQTAYLITDMLQTVVTQGTGTRARIDRPTAGKTGTTELPPEFGNVKGTRDAWFVGYTPELVGAVWMGYDSTDQKHYLTNVAGGSYPAAIFQKVMQVAHEGKPVRAFPRPAGIVYVPVDVRNGLLPSELTPAQFVVTEVFAKDRVPTKVSQAWVQVQICTESGKRATANCPSVGNQTFSAGEAPTDYCPIHGSSDQNQGVRVTVCTDSHHGGTLYLANIPSAGQGGGCPLGMVETRTVSSSQVPMKYCPLKDHQVYNANDKRPGKDRKRRDD